MILITRNKVTTVIVTVSINKVAIVIYKVTFTRNSHNYDNHNVRYKVIIMTESH